MRPTVAGRAAAAVRAGTWTATGARSTTSSRWLFDLLRGAATVGAAGVRWYGLLVCAIDGTTMSVPDSPANLTQYRKHHCHNGGSGYPLLRLLALTACGTRSIIDAVFGPTSSGETTYARQLLPSLKPGMIVLLDRNFDHGQLLNAIAATKAELLVRLKRNRNLPVLARYPDGSYLSTIATTRVRVVAAEITIATSAGHVTGSTGWPPPCSTTTTTRPSNWSGSTTSGGRSKPPTLS